MLKGTHHSKTKNQLSDDERELLTKMLEFTDSGPLYLITSKNVCKMMDWDIRKTTVNLSSIVGLDLCTESDVKSFVKEGTEEFSSSEPVYGIKPDSEIYRRAVYARNRIEKGSTLFHIIRGDEKFGKKLWPFRPVDRVKLEGKVLGSGKLQITYNPKDFVDMIGHNVSVVIQS